MNDVVQESITLLPSQVVLTYVDPQVISPHGTTDEQLAVLTGQPRALRNRWTTREIDAALLARQLSACRLKVLDPAQVTAEKGRRASRTWWVYVPMAFIFTCVGLVLTATYARPTSPLPSIWVFMTIFACCVGSPSLLAFGGFFGRSHHGWLFQTIGEYESNVPRLGRLATLVLAYPGIVVRVESFVRGSGRYDHFLVVRLGEVDAYIDYWRDSHRA